MCILYLPFIITQVKFNHIVTFIFYILCYDSVWTESVYLTHKDSDMKKRIFNLLKIICLLLCVIFLATACSNDGDTEGGTFASGSDSDPDAVAKAQRQCWQGALLKTFYENLGSMSISVYNKLTNEDLLSVMMIAFAFWMAFQILRHVSSTSPESIGEFWTKVLRKAALCAICGTLASSTENIMYALNTFVFPIYITLLEFCAQILEIVGKDDTIQAIKLSGATDNETCEVFPYSMRGCGIENADNIKISATSFPTEPMNLMICMACAVGAKLDIGYSIAMKTLSLPGLAPVFVAIFLIATFTIAKFGFALYIVDSVFRLDMMVVIAPFLIMFYPFEQTRKWTGVGFKIILNSAAIMLCLAILVSMTIQAMMNVLSNPKMGINFGDKAAFENFGVIPITLIFMGIIILKSSGLAVTLSESVTGGGGDTRFQKKMAALLGTVAKGLFVLATWGSGKAVTTAIEHSERLKALHDKVQKAKAKVNKVRNTMNRIAGRK